MRGIIWHRMLESRRVAASVMVVLVCVLLAMICNADEPAKRMPVPDAAARQAAVKTVRDIYKNDLAKAITSEQFAAVATELIKTAGETKGDPAGQFALLQVATEVATQAGNAKAAMAAVNAVVELF